MDYDLALLLVIPSLIAVLVLLLVIWRFIAKCYAKMTEKSEIRDE